MFTSRFVLIKYDGLNCSFRPLYKQNRETLF